MAETTDGGDNDRVHVPVDDTGNVHVQAHIDEGGGFDHTTDDEEIDMTKVVENRGNVHVQVPVDGEGGAVHTDVATVGDRDAMDKHVDGGDVQDMVAGDGVSLDEGGGTDSIQADMGGDLTNDNRGGNAIHATVDAVEEA